MRIIGIIQARIGSKRLPNKVMLDFNGFPIIDWVVNRSRKSKMVKKFVVSIPNTTENDDLYSYLTNELNVDVFRGSEDDLVLRFLDTARLYKPENIVRICADNPLICASEIDRLVNIFFSDNFDYSFNHIPRGNNYPDGLGAEICTLKLLKHIDEVATDPIYREHIFNFIWERRENYKIKKFNAPNSISYPKLKLDVNNIEEYKSLISKPYDINMSAEEIVKLANS